MIARSHAYDLLIPLQILYPTWNDRYFAFSPFCLHYHQKGQYLSKPHHAKTREPVIGQVWRGQKSAEIKVKASLLCCSTRKSPS